eukprot:GHVU01124857.1.p1 GENE.GHVU01124857.1~~GHVU01124857.1.p1  ORF type:complete len:116 (-),score=14.57 GHVU01124857.1:341-688(-)
MEGLTRQRRQSFHATTFVELDLPLIDGSTITFFPTRSYSMKITIFVIRIRRQLEGSDLLFYHDADGYLPFCFLRAPPRIAAGTSIGRMETRLRREEEKRRLHPAAVFMPLSAPPP